MNPTNVRNVVHSSIINSSSSRAHELRKRVENKTNAELNKTERAQIVPRKKVAASRPWLQIDSEGNSKVIEADKYAIMKRVSLPARDLRILDPLLSYPSTILGREKAIVVNLDQIKCIITAEEVLLLNWKNEIVANLVKELKHRLPLHFDALGEQVAGDGGGGLSDSEIEAAIKGSKRDKKLSFYPFTQKSTVRFKVDQIKVENQVKSSFEEGYSRMRGPNALPFEFRALEACLESACGELDSKANLLEKEAYPALDELTVTISTLNLERVRQIKSRLVTISGSVQKVRDELEQLLDDDEDMREMYLTDKLHQQDMDSTSSITHRSNSSSPPYTPKPRPFSVSEYGSHSGGKFNERGKGKVREREKEEGEEEEEEREGEEEGVERNVNLAYVPLGHGGEEDFTIDEQIKDNDDDNDNDYNDNFDDDNDDELSKGLLDSPKIHSHNLNIFSSTLHSPFFSTRRKNKKEGNSKPLHDNFSTLSSIAIDLESKKRNENTLQKRKEEEREKVDGREEAEAEEGDLEGGEEGEEENDKVHRLPRFDSLRGRRSKMGEGESEKEKEKEKDGDTSVSSKSGSSSSTSSGKNLDVEELEMLLEAYFVQIEGTLNKLSTLREYVEDTEDYINIMLDDKQNSLLQMNVMLTLGTLVISMFVVVTAVFGMNIDIYLFKEVPQNYPVFYYVVSGSTFGCFLIFLAIVAYCRWKRLIDI